MALHALSWVLVLVLFWYRYERAIDDEAIHETFVPIFGGKKNCQCMFQTTNSTNGGDEYEIIHVCELRWK